MRRLILWLAVLVPSLQACSGLSLRQQADEMPLFAPSAYGAEVAGLQRLTITRDNGSSSLVLDAAMEIDAGELRVAGFMLGQRVLLLTWDGNQIRESRESVVPKALSARTVLSMLQLTYWPEVAILADLPSGWRFEELAGQRKLYHGSTLIFESVRRHAASLGDALLQNHLEHYRIAVELAHEPG